MKMSEPGFCQDLQDDQDYFKKNFNAKRFLLMGNPGNFENPINRVLTIEV